MNGLRILEKAPAKINLSLDVRRKRPDGYHEVEMVMTTIDLADRVELTELAEDKVTVSSHNRFVPDDQRNLAYQAAMLMKERYGIKKGFPFYYESDSRCCGPCRRKQRCGCRLQRIEPAVGFEAFDE